MFNEVYQQSCVEYLQSPFCIDFDFIFADPFFNIGQAYNGFNDSMTADEYHSFTKEWVSLAWNKLKPGCAMYLHGSVEVGFVYQDVFKELDLRQHFDRKIIWGYNFGQNQYNNFVNTHCEIWVLRKPGERRWNFDSIKVPSKRLLGGDKRVLTAKHKGYVCPGSVWGLRVDDDSVVTEPIEGDYRWGRVQGNNNERVKGCPNQLPEFYLRRAIAANTFPQDTVYDPFGGSGTTSVVAKALLRNSVTTDVGEFQCEQIRLRLERGIVE